MLVVELVEHSGRDDRQVGPVDTVLLRELNTRQTELFADGELDEDLVGLGEALSSALGIAVGAALGAAVGAALGATVAQAPGVGAGATGGGAATQAERARAMAAT